MDVLINDYLSATRTALDENADPAESLAGNPHEMTRCQLDVQHWYRRVYALCQSRLISRSDAEDATQETFARGLARIDELRSNAAIGAWLRQIARNVCVDIIRRQTVRRTSPLDVQAMPADAHHDPTSDRDQREHLMRLINALPDSNREIVLLHYYEDMTYEQMADWLGIARSTVSERLSKARYLLKTQLAMTENTT